VFQLIFEEKEREAEERETWDCKGGNFRLSVFVVRFSWVGKHCKHLG